MNDPSNIKNFMDITGSDETTAKFFLSAANGDSDVAVSSFFDAGGVIPSGGTGGSGSTLPTSSTRGSSSTGGGPVQKPEQDIGKKGGSSSNRGSTSGIATLSSLNRGNNGRGEDEDDDEDDAQDYYAGGEKSGQIVQGPRKSNNEGGEGGGDEEQSLAERIFETARRRGPRAEQENGRFEDNQSFAGAGYRLGDENNEAPSGPDVVGRRNVRRVLTFYANGFRVDEGALRAYDDPANEQFLRDVDRGLVPREMEQPGLGDVSITLVDKKSEEFEEKKERIAFTGDGNRLSNIRSNVEVEGAVDRDAANAVLKVDENRPVANVQVRLSDGTRLVARLNLDHTIGDLRGFVRASRPGVENFILSTTFPRKVLEEDGKTIDEEGLKGAVVVQTLK